MNVFFCRVSISVAILRKVNTMDKSNIKNTGSALIVIAGVFWGLMGLFVRSFAAYGFSSAQVACLRLGVGTLIFALIMLVKDRRLFYIKLCAQWDFR